MPSAPLYSLEESLERATISALTGITALSGLSMLRADLSDEAPLPRITVRAEKEEAIGNDPANVGAWAARLTVSLHAPADDDDTDGGAADMQEWWKALTDTLTASTFKTNINAAEVCFVWGLEWTGSTYDQGDRSFTRTTQARVFASYAYAT